MAIERESSIPAIFHLPPGTRLYSALPNSEVQQEGEIVMRGEIIFHSLLVPPHRTHNGYYLHGRITQTTDVDKQWEGWALFYLYHP